MELFAWLTLGYVFCISEVTFVPVSKVSGQAEVEDVLAAVRPTTCLVTIMLANNETGVIMVSQPFPLQGGLGEKVLDVGISLCLNSACSSRVLEFCGFTPSPAAPVIHSAPIKSEPHAHSAACLFPLQPVPEISRRIKALNQSRAASGLPRVLVHTDAAQALGKRRVDVEDLGVDFLTIVGHKVCVQGPPALLLDTAEWSPQPHCPFLLKSLWSSSELQVPVKDQVLRCHDNHSGRALSSELSVHVWDRTSNS